MAINRAHNKRDIIAHQVCMLRCIKYSFRDPIYGDDSRFEGQVTAGFHARQDSGWRMQPLAGFLDEARPRKFRAFYLLKCKLSLARPNARFLPLLPSKISRGAGWEEKLLCSDKAGAG